MSLELIATLLSEFHEKLSSIDGGVTRLISVPDLPHKINVLMGMRRTGKTYYLLQMIKNHLFEIPLSRILYINFEDDRLLPCSQSQFAALIENFYSLYPENHQQTCYLFFDEIQNVENWPLVVRRFFDTKKVRIFLTGSSAKLLSTEIASSLRGRSIATEMWPFNFDEYCISKNLILPKRPISQAHYDLSQQALQNYLLQGGFPETINLDLIDHHRILQDYLNVVIARDIIDRYSVTNITLLRYLIKTMLKLTSSSFSVNKIFNDLKSQGFSVAKTTIHEYLQYIEDAYLSFHVPLYSESLRKMQVNPRKIYSIDSGLVQACTLSYSPNFGRLFENLIYLELRRQGHEIYYYLTEDRLEVDFLARDIEGRLHLYQIAWDTSDKDNYEREFRALKKAEHELGISGSLITPRAYLKQKLMPSPDQS